MTQPLLSVNNLTHLYAPGKGFSDVSFDLWPGEVLGIVGESGSGKTTLLKSISSRLTPQSGEILYQNRSLYGMNEADRRRLLRTEWGVVHQHPLDGLRRQVSAGGNIGERLMATGARHYGDIRATAQRWLEEVEIPASRIDDLPTTFPAVCSSACRSPATSSPIPNWCLWTNPPAGWTFRYRPNCWTCCAAWWWNWILQWSLSPTIWVWRVCWQTVCW